MVVVDGGTLGVRFRARPRKVAISALVTGLSGQN